MRFIISFLFSLFCYVGVFAQTPNDNPSQPKYLVEGLFFNNSVPLKSLLPSEGSLIMLPDSVGNIIFGIYLPKDYVLADSIKAKAIPTENVKYSKRLLRDYDGRRPRQSDYQGVEVKVGEPFIKFEYTDIDNNVWNNKKLKDKIYVINIWQSECGPCRREMPILSSWKEKYPNVVFLSASRHNKEEITPIAQRHNFTWTHLQEASDIVALVGRGGFPLTIIVDKNGIVCFAKVGASEQNQAEAIETIKKLVNF